MKKIATSVFAWVGFLFFIGFLLSCSPDAGSIKKSVDYQKYLTNIYPDFMITPDEAQAWHVHKDKGGPTYSGNESW